MKLTKITLQKLQDTPDPASKKPTHNIVASDDNYANKTNVASLWTKEGQYGKYLSGEMKKSRTYEGKEYDGYVIITEKEWNEYQDLKKGVATPVITGGYTGEVKDISEIDF